MARENRRNRQYRESLEILRKTLNIDLDNDLVFEELDELFIAWGKPEEAISFYHELEQGSFGGKAIFLRLSRQYKILQDYDNVRKYYHKVLELDPHCQEAKNGIVDS